MSTIAQENAAARARAGVRTVTHEQLEALKNSSATQTRARATATAVSRTSEDVYANPPDPYARALDAGRKAAQPDLPDLLAGTPPDGYAIALDKQRKEK